MVFDQGEGAVFEEKATTPQGLTVRILCTVACALHVHQLMRCKSYQLQYWYW
jgi:hypothetical protein